MIQRYLARKVVYNQRLQQVTGRGRERIKSRGKVEHARGGEATENVPSEEAPLSPQ